MDSKKVLNTIRGASTIGDLFAGLIRHAAAGLDSADVAALLRATIGDIDGLSWIAPDERRRVIAHVDGLAVRAPHERLRLRKPERERLVSLLGGESALDDARLLFVLAHAVDERFASVTPRVSASGHSAVLEVPVAFFAEASNAPPPLGQMTPLAAVRRWMRAFWYVGDARKLDVFGPLPNPRRRDLSDTARQALQAALDERELRLSVASWRQHKIADLRQLVAAEGCFAVGGIDPEPTREEITRLLEVARLSAPHVLLFPELSFSAPAFDLLVEVLKADRARFPALIIGGKSHRPRASGGHLNAGFVLDAAGRILLEHEKLEPFSWRDEESDLLEDIVPRASDDYQYLDTPVGRLVVNVCRDVRSDIPMIMNRTIGASLLAVPAYSKRLDFVLEEARVLGARQLTVSLSANPPGEGIRDGVAVYAPLRGGEEKSFFLRTADPSVTGTVHNFSLILAAGNRAAVHAGEPANV